MLKAFPLRSGTRQGFPHLPLLFNIVLEVLARAISYKREIKGIQTGKEEENCHYMQVTLYIENPKGSIKKIVRTVNRFSKVVGHKINTQKSVVFPYTNKKDQKERKPSHLQLHQKNKTTRNKFR